MGGQPADHEDQGRRPTARGELQARQEQVPHRNSWQGRLRRTAPVHRHETLPGARKQGSPRGRAEGHLSGPIQGTTRTALCPVHGSAASARCKPLRVRQGPAQPPDGQRAGRRRQSGQPSSTAPSTPCGKAPNGSSDSHQSPEQHKRYSSTARYLTKSAAPVNSAPPDMGHPPAGAVILPRGLDAPSTRAYPWRDYETSPPQPLDQREGPGLPRRSPPDRRTIGAGGRPMTGVRGLTARSTSPCP
jgi:hypothetical protein